MPCYANGIAMKKSICILAGLCLFAGAHADFTLTVLHTNDLHAHIEPSEVGRSTFGGYAKHATLIKRSRTEDPNTILLNGGDTFQGTLYFTQYTGMADLSLMNVVGYDGMAVGNHEFDLGPDPLAQFAKHATFPVLSANLDVSANRDLSTSIKPHAIKVIGGQKIGLIGATTPDLPSISSPGPTVKLLALVPAIEKSIQALRSEGVNKIILLSHLGYDLEKEVARTCSGLDVIVGGHSHSYLGQATGISGFASPHGPYPTVVESRESKVLLVSAWEWGKVLGRIKVLFDDDGKVESWSDAVPILVENSIPDDPTVASLVAALSRPIESLRKTVVATTPYALTRENSRIGNSNLGNLICDSMLDATQGSGTKLALMNNGGIRSNISQGPITFNEIIEVSPFGNTLVVLDLTGEELIKTLETGAARWGEDGRGVGIHVSRWAEVKYDVKRPPGKRVVSAKLNGEPIEKNRTYRVVVNSFMATGGDDFVTLRDAKGYRIDTGSLDRDAMIEFLKKFKGEDLTGTKRIEVVGS